MITTAAPSGGFADDSRGPARPTAGERDVLGGMERGHTNAAIAEKLHVSQSAVEST